MATHDSALAMAARASAFTVIGVYPVPVRAGEARRPPRLARGEVVLARRVVGVASC